MSRNHYNKALKSVIEILQFYDHDKKFPLLGFGANLETGMQSSEGDDAVSHCFALNGNIFDPECPGLDGVLKTYQNALHHVKLNGPTNFNKVIDLSNSMAEAQNVSQTN